MLKTCACEYDGATCSEIFWNRPGGTGGDGVLRPGSMEHTGGLESITKENGKPKVRMILIKMTRKSFCAVAYLNLSATLPRLHLCMQNCFEDPRAFVEI